ncbi:MAG: hypothetical protein QXH37_08975 [Candidatus Bathyarchaeia archaeon]
MLIIAMFYEKRPKGQYLSSIRVTITYMDDTKRTINSTNYLFGKFIPDSGEVARRIKIELCITPFYDEDIQAYSVTGSWRWQIAQNSTVLHDSGSIILQPFSPLPPLVNGASTVIDDAIFSVSDHVSILNVVGGKLIDGETYTFIYRCESLTLNISFADGSIQNKSAPIEAEWRFRYEGGFFKSLSVSFHKLEET